MFKFDFAKEN